MGFLGTSPDVGTLRQNTAYTRMFYLGSAGLSPTVTISKAGGAFGAPAGALAEVSDGWYKLALTAADTDTLGDLVYNFSPLSGVRLADNTRIVSSFVPRDLQSATDGLWVAVAANERITIIFHKAAGTAGDDPTVRVQQAADESGTSAADLNFTEYWLKQGASLDATSGFTKPARTLAASLAFNSTSAEQQILAVIEFNGTELTGGRTHVRFRCDDVGFNTQLGSAIYIINQLAHVGALRSDFRDKVVA